jgi:hypothetical protein
MKICVLFWFLSLLLCCKQAELKNEDSKTVNNESHSHSIERNYEREQIENLKLQDTLLGYMGYSSIDQHQLSSLSDRFYRLSIFEAIGPKFTIVELFNDTSKHLLKRVKYKLHEDCNPVTGINKMSSDCFIKEEQCEKLLTPMEFDSLNVLIEKAEILDLKMISQRFRDDIIFDGEGWRLDILYMIHDTRTDSNYLRTHTVYRFLPEYFQSVYTVGSYIKQLGPK